VHPREGSVGDPSLPVQLDEHGLFADHGEIAKIGTQFLFDGDWKLNRDRHSVPPKTIVACGNSARLAVPREGSARLQKRKNGTSLILANWTRIIRNGPFSASWIIQIWWLSLFLPVV
jgi:hypothetical protein